MWDKGPNACHMKRDQTFVMQKGSDFRYGQRDIAFVMAKGRKHLLTHKMEPSDHLFCDIVLHDKEVVLHHNSSHVL